MSSRWHRAIAELSALGDAARAAAQRVHDVPSGQRTTAAAISYLAETDAAPNSLEWRVDSDTETWWHLPPGGPAGFQEVQDCAPDGYNFARLVWQACERCHLGIIVKIRVTGPWQRHGYGSRIVRFALRGRDGYRWSTTPQSEDAQAFFPALTAATGVAFPRQAHHRCEHMRAGESRHAQPKQPLDLPPR